MSRYYHARLTAGGSPIAGTIVATITEARRWAEEHGTTADLCTISDLRRWVPRADHPARRHPVVAVHRRDPNGDGTRWYRAAPEAPPIDDGRTIDRDPLAAAVWGR